MSARCYAVVFETKLEGPIIWEGKPVTYQQAIELAKTCASNASVIRVAVVKLDLTGYGNETIIEQEVDF